LAMQTGRNAGAGSTIEQKILINHSDGENERCSGFGA
jgi:hypothetical protein